LYKTLTLKYETYRFSVQISIFLKERELERKREREREREREGREETKLIRTQPGGSGCECTILCTYE